MCLFLLGIVATWQNLQVQHYSYEIESLREEVRQEQVLLRSQQAELESLRNPNRLVEKLNGSEQRFVMPITDRNFTPSSLRAFILEESGFVTAESAGDHNATR